MSHYTMIYKNRERMHDFSGLFILFYSTFLYFGGVFNKTIIPLERVGYEMIHGKKLGDICFKFLFSSPGPRKTTRKSQKNSKLLSVSLNFAPLKVTFSRCTGGFKKCSSPSI